MERWLGRVAVVTGASAGIGAAIAADLVKSGMVVVGLDKQEERTLELKNLQGESGTLHFLRTDVTREDEVKTAFKWIKDNVGGVDVLVNNAGILIKGLPCEGKIEDWHKMFAVNVFALGLCTREALSSMKERDVDDGHIVNINSLASHRISNLPELAPYTSSKFASKAITEGVRIELATQQSKIKVTSISPGLVNTDIFEANLALSAASMLSRPHLEPKDIADAVHYVLASPPHVQVNELIIRPVGSGF